VVAYLVGDRGRYSIFYIYLGLNLFQGVYGDGETHNPWIIIAENRYRKSTSEECPNLDS